MTQWNMYWHYPWETEQAMLKMSLHIDAKPNLLWWAVDHGLKSGVCGGGGDNLTVLLVQSCRHPAWLPYKHHCCLSYVVYMFFPSSRTKILKHPPKTPSCLPSFGSCCLSSGSLSALQNRLQELEAGRQTMFHNDVIVMFNLRYPKKELLRGLLYNISVALYSIIMHYNVATGYIDC